MGEIQAHLLKSPGLWMIRARITVGLVPQYTLSRLSFLYHTFSLTTVRAPSLVTFDIVYFCVFFDVGSDFLLSCVFGCDFVMGLLVPKFLTESQFSPK